MIGVKDVFAKLDEVSQGKHTLQSMVFEPAQRTLNLAYGEGMLVCPIPLKMPTDPKCPCKASNSERSLI